MLIQVPLVLKNFLASGTLKGFSATKPDMSFDVRRRDISIAFRTSQSNATIPEVFLNARSTNISIALWTRLGRLVELLCVLL